MKNIPVTKGEVVEFRVIWKSYYGAFVGVQETIAFKTRSDSLAAMFRAVH